MNRKKRLYMVLLCSLCVLGLLGCRKVEKQSAANTYIYYVNDTGTTLGKEDYTIKNKSPKAEITLMLKQLQKTPESSDYKSAFPQGVSVDSWEFDDGKLDLYFGESYGRMDKASEVLLRAAVVQSLVQIKGVEYVDFYVNYQPITDSEGNPVGFMRAEDFVQNTGSSLHTYQVADLQLYFANKKGDKLEKEKITIRYNSNISIEKLIVEQLIKGPTSSENQATIPPETKVLGVSIKDNICYVNFDEGFVNMNIGIDPKIAVYSIVNSIASAGSATQVQISVNGETDVMLQGSVDLSKPFSKNMDLAEETK